MYSMLERRVFKDICFTQFLSILLEVLEVHVEVLFLPIVKGNVVSDETCVG